MVHGETFDVMLVEIDPFVRIDVSDGYQDYALEGEVGEPLETWKVTELRLEITTNSHRVVTSHHQHQRVFVFGMR